MTYDRRWYACEIRDAGEAEPPDFSRVPKEKRAMVEERWRRRAESAPTSRWRLWGPQIEAYQKLDGMSVTVLGVA